MTIPIPAPMLATPGGLPFTSAYWLYEIKFDGYRCVARAGSGPVELRTKTGANCTAWCPEVAEALAKVPGGPHVIDGELCVLMFGDLPAETALFSQAVEPLLLEGFVAKRRVSTYQPGVRARDWLKIKHKGAIPAERFRL